MMEKVITKGRHCLHSVEVECPRGECEPQNLERLGVFFLILILRLVSCSPDLPQTQILLSQFSKP